MNSAVKKIKTVHEQWLELPDIVVGEIIAGDLHVSPRPAPRHSIASSVLGAELMGPFNFGKNGGPGGWIILDEPELHLDGHILVPDIAGWRRERMPAIPDEAFFSLVPDWACEVLSPSTAVLDRVKKMPLYLSLGLKYFWLVDPIARTLEVYENDHQVWKLICSYANDDKVRAIPFDALEIELADLWG